MERHRCNIDPGLLERLKAWVNQWAEALKESDGSGDRKYEEGGFGITRSPLLGAD